MAGHSETIWSVAARMAAAAAEKAEPTRTSADITAEYADDPIGFARDVLRVWLSKDQQRILLALRDGSKVSVASGHKVGKSTTFSVAALWFYCSYRNARVVITAASDRQVNGIIWREIKRLAKNAAIPIPGADHGVKRALTGWDHPTTDSEIRGYTAAEAEAIAGISGEAVLYLCDEASGIDDRIFDAIEGNRAGGNAKVGMISNPTRAEGQFYRSHHAERKSIIGISGWDNIHVSSEDSPNCTGEWREMKQWDSELEAWVPRTKPVPGMAMPEWVEEKRQAWGADSARYKIRVKGEFSAAEELKAFQLALIEAAQERWAETLAAGRLYIGCDPAGEGGQGDDTGMCARRGKRVVELRERRGLSPEAHMAEFDDLMSQHATEGDALENNEPIIVIDAGGDVGARVHAHIKAVAMRRKHTGVGRQFWVVKSRPSDRAVREPETYHLIRDELVANARQWMRDGGAIPTNARLEEELHAGEFKTDLQDKLKYTPKDELRKLLGRSPDLADAFCLSCWVPRFAQQNADDKQRASPQPTKIHPIDRVAGGSRDAGYGDPYGGGFGGPY